MIGRFQPQFVRGLSDAYLAGFLGGAQSVAAGSPAMQARTPIEPHPAVIAGLRPPRAILPLVAPAPVAPESAVSFPAIEAAANHLAGRQAMTADEFARLGDAARRQAFTVAELQTAEAVGKVQAALVDAVRDGTTLLEFRARLEREIEDSPLGSARQEQLFRDAVNTAHSAGVEGMLNDPVVGDDYPYAAYFAVHDPRARHEHLQLEHLGIAGTNVYRRDDPVWAEFRPPWEWQCRCAWTPLTIEQAAGMGVPEAKEWLATGNPPQHPAWVSHPPFNAPKDYPRG